MNLHTGIATVFGIGRARAAPGTVASLLALPVAWIIAAGEGRVWLLAAAILVAAAGGWACELYVRETGKSDPSECVIDEVAGQWLACAFAPLSILHGLPAYALAFVLFRIFDIAKPWPLSAAERLPGGAGVMADDLLAGLIAGLIVAVFAHAGWV